MDSFKVICVVCVALMASLCCFTAPSTAAPATPINNPKDGALTCDQEFQNLDYSDTTWAHNGTEYSRCTIGCSNDGAHFCETETRECHPQLVLFGVYSNAPGNWGTCTMEGKPTGKACFDDVVYQIDQTNNNINMTCRVLSEKNPGEGATHRHKDENTILLCPQSTDGKPYYARPGNFQGKRRNACVCPSYCPTPCGQFHGYCAGPSSNGTAPANP
eukprot:Nk52_evm8s1892 gene=Nk52_evmTU8s1892